MTGMFITSVILMTIFAAGFVAVIFINFRLTETADQQQKMIESQQLQIQACIKYYETLEILAKTRQVVHYMMEGKRLRAVHDDPEVQEEAQKTIDELHNLIAEFRTRAAPI